MRPKYKLLFFILSILVLILFISSSCTQKKEALSEDYVNFKVGNQWTYIIEMKPKADEPASPEKEKGTEEKEATPDSTGKKKDVDIVKDTSEKAKENNDKSEDPGKSEAEKKQSASEVTFKISGIAEIDGIKCFIKETITNQDKNPKEYYELNPEKGLLLRKQDFFVFDPETGSLKLTEAKVDPPRAMLEFPLKEGKSWTREINMGGLKQSAVFLVKGEEQVETPAGTFTAIKLESHGGTTGDAGATSGAGFSAFQWYAKEVGMVKEIVEVENGTSTTVLKEYKPGP